MDEYIVNLVTKLQEEYPSRTESEPYFSIFGEDYGLLVDWNTSGVNVPDSVRIITLNDADGDMGYIGCIRFDVVPSSDSNDIPNVQYAFAEAEYYLEGSEGRVELLKTVIDDIFSYSENDE